MTIGFWSKTLLADERNYSNTEIEFISVVWTVKTLWTYIEGTQFVVLPYHDALRCIIN